MLTQRQLEVISEKAKGYEPSEKAFSCMRGEGCSKEECPAWIDLQWLMEDTATGEKVRTPVIGCQFILRPIFDADIIETTYRNIDSSREVVKKIDNYETGITAKIQKGFIAIMRFIGVANIQEVLKENEDLKKQLKEQTKLIGE